MRVALGADHAGFELKELLVETLRDLGHVPVDVGTHDRNPVDYPDIAVRVAREMATGDTPRGILVCGSGVGVSVAANKLAGIRAGLCHDVYSAHQGVEHDDMNVLVLGARVIGPGVAPDLARLFLDATFNREERHLRRLRKVLALENSSGESATPRTHRP